MSPSSSRRSARCSTPALRPSVGGLELLDGHGRGLAGREHREAAVAGDGEQPRAQLVGRALGDQRAVGAQEGLLERVLALVLGAEHVPAEAEQRPVMAVVDGLEGALVARSRRARRGGRRRAFRRGGGRAGLGLRSQPSGHSPAHPRISAGVGHLSSVEVPVRRRRILRRRSGARPGSTVTRTSSSSATWSPSTCHGTGRPSPERITTSRAPSKASTRRWSGIAAVDSARNEHGRHVDRVRAREHHAREIARVQPRALGEVHGPLLEVRVGLAVLEEDADAADRLAAVHASPRASAA